MSSYMSSTVIGTEMRRNVMHGRLNIALKFLGVIVANSDRGVAVGLGDVVHPSELVEDVTDGGCYRWYDSTSSGREETSNETVNSGRAKELRLFVPPRQLITTEAIIIVH